MIDTAWKDYLPPTFLKNLDTYFGARAELFLNDLPSLIKRYEAAWNIEVQAPFPNLSFNYVAPAVGNNNQVYVFKCGVPNEELNTEIDTLMFMDGVALPKLIQASKQDAVLLQQHISPGISLRRELQEGRLTDSAATEVAAVAMQMYFQQASKPIPESYSFPHVRDWLQALEEPDFRERKSVFPKALLERSEYLLPHLLASTQHPILLHGDLHHDNIISHNDGWMVIDPKGILGEVSYEIGAFLRNPQELVHYTDLKSTMQKRIDIFSEVLEVEPRRIAAWMIVQAVLSIWWSISGDETIKSSNDLDDGSRVVLESALSVIEIV